MTDISEQDLRSESSGSSPTAGHSQEGPSAANQAESDPAQASTESLTQTVEGAPTPRTEHAGGNDQREHAQSQEQSHDGGERTHEQAHEQAHDGDDADDGDASDEEVSASGDVSAADGAPGQPTGKRKRRRRKKRRDGTSAAGEITAAGETTAAGRPAPRKKESHAPFAHLFGGGQANKRHAFAVGEVVAGRVQRVEHGVIVVDLFGKAIAIVDEYEPRDVALIPVPDPNLVQPPAASSAPVTTETDSADSKAQDTSAGVAADDGAAVASATAVTEHVEQPASESVVATTTDEDAATLVGETSAVSVGVGEELDHDHDRDDHEDHGDHSDHHEDDDSDADVEPALAAEPEREKPEAPKLGQVWKGRVAAVSESGHIALMNRLLDPVVVRAGLEQLRTEHKRVQGIVYGFNRGGFDVLVEGLRAFCPASAMSLEEIPDPLEYVGKKLEFLLPASKAGSKDIIVSRRSILERLQRRKNKEFLRAITPGQRFKGRVTAVREFGLFVDIGGVEGLVHQSELSFAFGVKPSSVAQPGDEIDVQVLKVGGEPKQREANRRDRLTRVSLSVKALLPDPWQAHAEALSEGSIHKGKVVRATEFGAFISLVDSIEGLLHITELGRDLKHADQAVREGDEIYVAVERVDRHARRISLSKLSSAEIKEFEAGNLAVDDKATRNLRQGNNVKLKVERIEPRCLYARVAGTVGRRGRAFIPNSETGTERGTDLRKKFPPGSEFEAKIIGIDRDGSLKCSIKAMEIDEERKAVKDYRREASKQGFGTFGDLLRAKLGGS